MCVDGRADKEKYKKLKFSQKIPEWYLLSIYSYFTPKITLRRVGFEPTRIAPDVCINQVQPRWKFLKTWDIRHNHSAIFPLPKIHTRLVHKPFNIYGNTCSIIAYITHTFRRRHIRGFQGYFYLFDKSLIYPCSPNQPYDKSKKRLWQCTSGGALTVHKLLISQSTRGRRK